jgi:hypothetical protein
VGAASASGLSGGPACQCVRPSGRGALQPRLAAGVHTGRDCQCRRHGDCPLPVRHQLALALALARALALAGVRPPR